MEFNERIEKVHDIPLRAIIEAFGGTFIDGKQFTHPSFGHEKTPSGFIYSKGSKEYFKHFKLDLGGDGIDFVKAVTGVNTTIEAINMILGDDKNIKLFTHEESQEYKRQLIEKEAERINKERKRMFAILKNSVPLLDSDIGVAYFQKRGIDIQALKLNDPNIDIRVNSFKGKDGKIINNIVYFFNGNPKKNTHKFMILKGIDENGNKNGVKLNLLTCRPVIHQEEIGKPFVICEGIEDSLSAQELGYKNFISLNSTSSINKLITTMNTCRKWFTKNSFELCLDNDVAGKHAMNKLKIFCNLADNNFDNIKSFIREEILNCKDDKKLNLIKSTLKLLNNIKDLKEVDSNILIEVINNLTKLLPEDYFKDFGSTFKIKESECYGIMNELGYNDLNDLLVKEYKADFKEVIEQIFDNDYKPNEIAR